MLGNLIVNIDKEGVRGPAPHIIDVISVCSSKLGAMVPPAQKELVPTQEGMIPCLSR